MTAHHSSSSMNLTEGSLGSFGVLLLCCAYDLGRIRLLRHDLAFAPAQSSHATLYPPAISAKLTPFTPFFFPFQSGPH